MKEHDTDVFLAEQDRLLKPSEAAQMLRVSQRWLQALTKSGFIPSVRLGKRVVRYSRQDISDIITSHRRVAEVRS
jgi:excisionase family DNA binding protein